MAPPEGSGADGTTFDELMQPLAGKLAGIEARREVHHREELSFVAFVRLLVYYFVQQVASGRQLATDTISAAPELELVEVKRSTFFEAFQRFPVAWFQQLLTGLLTQGVWRAIPELEALGTLYCVDGSLFPALTSMLWAHYQRGHPAIRLHLCFELNRMVAVQFLVAKGNSNEKDALRAMLEQGVTYIADRGYVCFQLLADIVQANAHFVIRQKANLDYTVVEDLPRDLPDSAQGLFAGVHDQRVRLNNAKGQPIYRLVRFCVGEKHYLILTDRMDLTTFQVLLLYAYRWQVELIFRFLKRTLNGLHLLSTSKEGVTIQFYALVIAALLQLRLKQRCLTAWEKQHPAATPSAAADPSEAAAGSTFLATIGAKLQRYWKISVHWLVHLRNRLAKPFDQHTLRLLAGT